MYFSSSTALDSTPKCLIIKGCANELIKTNILCTAPHSEDWDWKLLISIHSVTLWMQTLGVGVPVLGGQADDGAPALSNCERPRREYEEEEEDF